MKAVKTKFIGIVQVIDPDTGNPVEVELRKLETGEIVGLDGSYLHDLADDEQPNNPYDEGKIVVPDDETALTAEQRDAVSEAMGYLPDDDTITSAVEEHAGERIAVLQTALHEKETVFRAQGGRGVKLADEIDRLRIALSLRPDKADDN